MSSATPDHEQGMLEKAARGLARALGVRPPLILAASTTTAWVWLSSGERPIDVRKVGEALSAAPEGVLAAAGSSAAGMAGFRRTHREAVAARRFAEQHPGRGRFSTYGGRPDLGRSGATRRSS